MVFDFFGDDSAEDAGDDINEEASGLSDPESPEEGLEGGEEGGALEERREFCPDCGEEFTDPDEYEDHLYRAHRWFEEDARREADKLRGAREKLGRRAKNVAQHAEGEGAAWFEVLAVPTPLVGAGLLWFFGAPTSLIWVTIGAALAADAYTGFVENEYIALGALPVWGWTTFQALLQFLLGDFVNLDFAAMLLAAGLSSYYMFLPRRIEGVLGEETTAFSEALAALQTLFRSGERALPIPTAYWVMGATVGAFGLLHLVWLAFGQYLPFTAGLWLTAFSVLGALMGPMAVYWFARAEYLGSFAESDESEGGGTGQQSPPNNPSTAQGGGPSGSAGGGQRGEASPPPSEPPTSTEDDAGAVDVGWIEDEEGS